MQKAGVGTYSYQSDYPSTSPKNDCMLSFNYPRMMIWEMKDETIRLSSPLFTLDTNSDENSFFFFFN